MFWASPKSVPFKSKKEFESFTKKFVQDKVWWDAQRTKCLYGYTVPNAVDFTQKGDCFVDGMNMEVLPDGGRYIKHLDIIIPPTGDVYISGRMYFYLNFWKISIEDKLQHS